MSSLVWKNLQLFDEDSCTTKGISKSKKAVKEKVPKDLIDTKRHGVKKELKRVKREKRKERSTILGEKGELLPSLRRSAAAGQSDKTKDHTEDNLQILQQLSATPGVDLKKAEKILNRATGQKILLVEKEEDTNTVFTEADFKKFAKIYIPD